MIIPLFVMLLFIIFTDIVRAITKIISVVLAISVIGTLIYILK
jgi:hypothetical protein